ncbi:hypothetical protein TGMAS_313460 [Toxoplasma gondii MAS]|uniref:Uncharacterized protein n=1 Tax=Toxoplasma gondii MAS TaxID=943118 RepID=A0A086QYV3_TOXGO|nr:hypothetical protein TGMAS_313460 [Toxoplasma gondii MAS]
MKNARKERLLRHGPGRNMHAVSRQRETECIVLPSHCVDLSAALPPAHFILCCRFSLSFLYHSYLFFLLARLSRLSSLYLSSPAAFGGAASRAVLRFSLLSLFLLRRSRPGCRSARVGGTEEENRRDNHGRSERKTNKSERSAGQSKGDAGERRRHGGKKTESRANHMGKSKERGAERGGEEKQRKDCRKGRRGQEKTRQTHGCLFREEEPSLGSRERQAERKSSPFFFLAKTSNTEALGSQNVTETLR